MLGSTSRGDNAICETLQSPLLFPSWTEKCNQQGSSPFLGIYVRLHSYQTSYPVCFFSPFLEVVVLPRQGERELLLPAASAVLAQRPPVGWWVQWWETSTSCSQTWKDTWHTCNGRSCFTYIHHTFGEVFPRHMSNETHNLYFEFGFFTEIVDHMLIVCLRNFEVQMLFLNSPFQSFVSLVIFAVRFPQIQVICPSVQKLSLLKECDLWESRPYKCGCIYKERQRKIAISSKLGGKQRFLLDFLCYRGLISQTQKEGFHSFSHH